MGSENVDVTFVVFLIGCVTIAAILFKSLLKQIKLPSLVGFIFLGVLLEVIDVYFPFLDAGAAEILEILGKMGLVTLLFLIGLESDLGGLVRQFKNAAFLWIVNITVSAVGGFLLAFYLFDLGLIPSLFIGTAFMATSVGVAIKSWKENRMLKTEKGKLLVDLAELDDISGIVFMTLLFTTAPLITSQADENILAAVSLNGVFILVKLVLFAFCCFLFSRYLEKKLTSVIQSRGSRPETMLIVASLGFLVASISEFIGFSLAIGAFFAGLIFSRDSKVVKMEESFLPLYDFFSPFFFISIGMMISFESLDSILVTGSILLVAAILLKIVGTFIPARFQFDSRDSLLLGVSMVPRAEITMIIMHHGLVNGYVTKQLFSSMVFVCIITCIITPVLVRYMHQRSSNIQ